MSAEPTPRGYPPRLKDSGPWAEALSAFAAEKPSADSLARVDQALSAVWQPPAAGPAATLGPASAAAPGALGSAVAVKIVSAVAMAALVTAGIAVGSRLLGPTPKPATTIATPSPVTVEDATSADTPPQSPSPTRSDIAVPDRPTPPKPTTATGLAKQAELLAAARAQADAGDAAAALALLDELERRFARGPLAPEAALLRATLLVRQGQTHAARALCERLVQDPALADKHAELYRLLGDLHARENDCTAARKAWLRALALGLERAQSEQVRQKLEQCP
jgi:hypothetical protein